MSQPDEPLSEAFWSVARRLRQAARESLAPWQLTPSQARALRVLDHHHDGLRLSQLSDHLHIAARSTTEVVDDLVAQGLVERRPDAHDRRATLVALTEPGRAVMAAIRAARGTESERLFDRLSPTDRANLGRILRKLSD